MIELQGTKRLSRESFPEQADWIEPLLAVINSQADAIEGLTAQLNAKTATVDLDIDVPGTYTAAFPKLLANPLGVRARHVYATYLAERTDLSATQTNNSRAVFVEWENSASSSTGALQIKIKNVSGLEVSTNYRITLKLEA